MSGVELIAIERARQQSEEGYDAAHDAGHARALALERFDDAIEAVIYANNTMPASGGRYTQKAERRLVEAVVELDAARAALTSPAPDGLREALAEIEHDQWIEWSRDIAAKENLSGDRLARWERYWVPYSELDEATKDHDRKWADRVLAALKGEPR